MFQRPSWLIANILFWVALHPWLRIVVYPQWELKPFIQGLEIMSATLLVLQALSLWTLYGWPRGIWRIRPWIHALGLFPLIWLMNAVVLWLLTEFRLVQDPLFEPLYDSQHFIRRYPISWTALGFLFSAVSEEIFFRGWLPDFLQKRMRKSAAIGLSAVLFALAHWSSHVTAQAFVAYILFALSLSYVRSFHGLAAAIGVHLLNNILAFAHQAFQFNVLAHLEVGKGLFLVALLLLGAGLYLVGNDLRQQIDKGAGPP